MIHTETADSKRKLGTVRLVYFSGTGCTARVAETFRKELESRGKSVQVEELRHGLPAPTGRFDSLVLCYAVHACTAPHPVLEWIDGLSPVSGIPATVISVSGGGEVTPNLASRVAPIRRLRRKGFGIAYEAMVAMPSNWIVATKPGLAARLLETLPAKVAGIVDDLEAGRPSRHRRTGLGNLLLSNVGKLETAGARHFGKSIAVGDACNACGLCSRRCPVGNIAMSETGPRFGGDCVLCLSCIYACPEKALAPGVARFIAIPEGFSLRAIEATLPWEEEVDVAEETKGLLWLGLRRYLTGATTKSR